jgi:hypothetical protein
MIDTFAFPDSCTKAINAGVPAIDVLHGELKNLMYTYEQELDNNSELQDDPTYKYLSGYLDALTYVYILAQQIDFNIIDRNSNEARG